jgi:lipocalin
MEPLTVLQMSLKLTLARIWLLFIMCAQWLIQQAAAAELNRWGLQWKELCQKNLDIEAACLQLEAEVIRLRDEASQKGVDLTLHALPR